MGVADRLRISLSPGTAARVYSEWVPRARDRGDIQTLSYLLSSYGFSFLQSAQPDKALPLCEEALGIERRLENRDMIVYMLDGLACHAAMVGRPQRVFAGLTRLRHRASWRVTECPE